MKGLVKGQGSGGQILKDNDDQSSIYGNKLGSGIIKSNTVKSFDSQEYDQEGPSQSDKIFSNTFENENENEEVYQKQKTNYARDIIQDLKIAPFNDFDDEIDTDKELKIPIFKESKNCTLIPTIEYEKKLVENNHRQQPKPVDTYLDHCKKFARTNMQKREFQIPEYTFTLKDFESQVLNMIVMEQMLSEDSVDFDYHKLTNDDVQKCFKMETMRLFLDFVFCYGNQYLLVKTWQKVSYRDKSQRLIDSSPDNQDKQSQTPLNKSDNESAGSENINIKNIQQQQELIEKQKDDLSFYIKTFQVFDKEGYAIGDPVMVEQVFGVFDNYRLYDTSLLHRDGKLYYFKRHFIEEEVQQDENDINFFEEKQKILNNNFISELEKNLLLIGLQRFMKLNRQKQFFQLFSYDMKSGKEKKIQDVIFQEQDIEIQIDTVVKQPPTIQTLQLIQRLKKKILMKDISDFKPQFNILLSMEFGSNKKLKYDDEMKWLKDQFFTIQKYAKKEESNTFKIFKIDEYSWISLKDNLIIEIESDLQIQDTNDSIRQVQSMNHIKNYSTRADDNKIHFLITNMFLLIQIEYDYEQQKVFPQKYYYRKSTDIFQRIWNNGGIIAQMIQITANDSGSKEDDFDQYFFIDSRNQIQLLFPQHETKVKKLKLIEVIGQKIKLVPRNFNYYKKITSVIHNIDGNVEYKNTIQQIDHLKRILDFDLINSSQSITFLKDFYSEVLFITEPSSQNILAFKLLDFDKIDCFQPEEALFLETHDGAVSPRGIIQIKSNYSQHEEPYLQYQPKQKAGKKQENMVKLDEDESLNHVYIDDFGGNKMKIKTFNLVEDEDKQQLCKLILYQQSQGNDFVFFLFLVQNRLQLGADDEGITKRSYVFIRKSYQEMLGIFQSMCKEVVIQNDDRVLIMKSYFQFELIKFSSIRNFQFRQEMKESYGGQYTPDKDSGDERITYIEIKIQFDNPVEDQCKINFFPFIYQEKQNNERLKMLMFDIVQNKISETISIGPTLENQDYLYEDELGYKRMILCRTSELNEEFKTSNLAEKPIQRLKYQIFTLFQEKVGRIMCEEFLIIHDTDGARYQTIGQKHLILSQKIIQDCEWINIRDSLIVPYQDIYGSIKGCQLLLKINQNTFSCISLQDQDMNNIYTFKTRVLLTGKKKFFINESKDIEQYVMVISTTFRKNVIMKNLFSRSEAYSILARSLDLMLSMRIPDIEYLILNTFEDLKNQDFFQSQEVLLGKSICDICLSEPDSINNAVRSYDFDSNQKSNGSVIQRITNNDQVRIQTFIQTSFYPKTLLLQIDLNLVGTIKRAIEFVNYKSLKILLSHVLQVIDTQDYQPIFMFDLPLIIDDIYIQVNDFFNISKTEKKDPELGFCNLEVEFKNPDLPVFHDKAFDFFVMSSFENFLMYEQDILRQVLYISDSSPQNVEKTNEIEYYYIDFTQMMIGEKIRNLNSKDRVKFDDLYYAHLMKIKCDGGDQTILFFQQETVQKLIDSQWILTKKIQKIIFMIYTFLYCIPMCVSSFKISNTIDDLMLKIAFIPALMLFFIEMIQFLEQGLLYFQGWNIIDSSQLAVYTFMCSLRILGFDNQLLFYPELKLVNITLAFMKLLFFIRIYEQFGFLVSMIFSCVMALQNFIISYIVFLLVISVCYVVLQMEVDADVDEAQGLSYFEKIVLQTFRTAIGELGKPKYENILKKDPSVFRDLNIFLIWFIWFVHVFFMLVIMLNFLIAVIGSNYEKAMVQQKLIGYRDKAELNYETYMLVNVFTKMKEYNCIVFQCSKSQEGFSVDEFQEKFESLKKMIGRENRRVMGDYSNLNERTQIAKELQSQMEKQVVQKFQQIDKFAKESTDEILQALSHSQGHLQSHHTNSNQKNY